MQDVLPRVFAGEAPKPSDVWLREVCLCRGEHYLIEAASGTGKSSLCSYLYGARRDYMGQILYDGVDVGTYDIGRWSQLRCRHIAYLPQEMGLFPELTARENIQLKNRLTGYKTDSQIEDMAAALGIDQRMDMMAGCLSIGQQQRVALLRALCQPCDFILLDEPVSHLDAANNRVVADMVLAEARAQGAGIITTSVGNRLLIDDVSRLSL